MKPPKPTALKKIEQGALKVHRENGTPAEIQVDKSEMPKPFLQMTKTEKQIWQKLGKMLFDLGLLSNLDRYVFACLVEAIAIGKKAKKEVNKYGIIVEGKKNPALTIWQQQQEIIYKYARLFGLSPSGQAGLEIAGIGKNKKDITFDEIKEAYSF